MAGRSKSCDWYWETQLSHTLWQDLFRHENMLHTQKALAQSMKRPHTGYFGKPVFLGTCHERNNNSEALQTVLFPGSGGVRIRGYRKKTNGFGDYLKQRPMTTSQVSALKCKCPPEKNQEGLSSESTAPGSRASSEPPKAFTCINFNEGVTLPQMNKPKDNGRKKCSPQRILKMNRSRSPVKEVRLVPPWQINKNKTPFDSSTRTTHWL